MPQPVTTVIFDYGGVLSLPADRDSLRVLADRCGLPRERFVIEYMRERLAYDRADVTLGEYWSRILGLAGRRGDPGLLEQLNRGDFQIWSRIDERVLRWSRRLRDRGLRTAVLSNMPQPLLDLMQADPSFAWLDEFTARVFSCEERLVKPEPGIYQVLLDRIGEPAGSCVFLDDSERNLEGARAVGIKAIHFSSPDKASRMLSGLGLPVL
jgi:putative hydrolase of the HAD superfamily